MANGGRIECTQNTFLLVADIKGVAESNLASHQ